MTFALDFVEEALKEWKKLDGGAKAQFLKKLEERLETPRVASAALRGMRDCYKIKLRSKGYRLVYQVKDDVVVVLVLAVGRRDEIYSGAHKRLPAG
ncbi:type II toxin-antitoxin system RelE/ParE family toxin [Trinickia sp. NRRL B-1857]|uniref:type II toxin-antitoxin system RelE family toxin n=1 Tax=Trinickia sp. NRRL B-1857 TaxID=3162879 RepID=UPI003D2AEC8E